jgi:hypothetical protein
MLEVDVNTLNQLDEFVRSVNALVSIAAIAEAALRRPTEYRTKDVADTLHEALEPFRAKKANIS